MEKMVLYDLKNGTATVIKKTAYKSAEQERLQIPSRLKNGGKMLAKAIFSVAVGVIFFSALSEQLAAIRGYEAIGGEFIATIVVVCGIFSLLVKK